MENRNTIRPNDVFPIETYNGVGALKILLSCTFSGMNHFEWSIYPPKTYDTGPVPSTSETL
jgi:hypothetical protein